MYDIELNEKELESLIQTLDKENGIIIETMEYMYKIMTEIDDNDWHSPEKERINNNFIPYIKEEEMNTKEKFYAKTKILKDALEAYRKKDNVLAEETKELEVFK